MPSAAGVLGFGKKQNNELRVLFVVVAAIFLVFLAIPMILVLVKSFTTAEGVPTGTNIEADLITMPSYYIDSAQDNNHMFQELNDVQSKPLYDEPAYRAPAQAQEGAIFYNTMVLEQTGLPVPTSFKDLADPIYEGMISVPDIDGSSTGWLMIQALIDAYGEGEAQPENATNNAKTFSEPLTVDLLERHREFSDECKTIAQSSQF